jgi:hypothetical protein
MEYGYVFPKGITHVETRVAVVEDLHSDGRAVVSSVFPPIFQGSNA